MSTKPFSLRIDDNIRAKLKREAKQLHRSESYVATEALKKYLAACEQKRQAIDTAIVRAEEGNFISSEKINTWVDSWGSENELPTPEVDITK